LVNSSAASAFYLLWIPVFAAPVLKGRREGRVPLFWALGLAAALLGLFLLDSDWALLCLAAAAPLAAGPRRLTDWIRRGRARAVRVAGAGAAAAALLLAWKFGHTTGLNGGTLAPGESVRRLYWWAAGLRMFAAHPLLGVGLGNYASAYRAFRVGAVQNTLYPHNVLVELLAETGLLGFASVAAFALGVLRRPELRGPEGETRWPFLLGLLSFALFAQVGLGVEYLANLLCCGIFLGILAAPASAPSWKPRRSVLIVAAAAALFAAPYLVSPFLADRDCVEGRRLLAAGRPADAVKEFASAAEISPRSSVAQQGWADALDAAAGPGGRAGILLHRRRAVELNRLAGALWSELGREQSAEGDPAGAQTSFETADALQFRPPAQR
jgi:O-antigen ligase